MPATRTKYVIVYCADEDKRGEVAFILRTHSGMIVTEVATPEEYRAAVAERDVIHAIVVLRTPGDTRHCPGFLSCIEPNSYKPVLLCVPELRPNAYERCDFDRIVSPYTPAEMLAALRSLIAHKKRGPKKHPKENHALVPAQAVA